MIATGIKSSYTPFKMAASEQLQPICLRDDALAIVQTLQRAGHIAYFAGGCVRDMLWNLPPKDFDVATDAPPARVRELFPKSQGVGQAFGVVLVRQSRSMIEVATFRADGSYSDGRRPDDVRFATAQEDAQRRDFTINGIFLDPVTDRVIDYVDGQADLQSRTLRAIGDPAKRFAEDYLRLLRAVRFTSRFDLNIHPATVAAIESNAHKLPRIAPERICDELRATFALANRLRSVKLLDSLGLTPVLFRGIMHRESIGTPSDRAMVASIDEPGVAFTLLLLTYAIDTLLHEGESVQAIFTVDRAEQISMQLRKQFRLSNDDTAEIETILAVGRLLNGSMPSVALMKRYLARPASAMGVRLLVMLQQAGLLTPRIADLRDAFSSFASDSIAPAPLIDGSDLQSLGYSPGPAFKRVLDSTYDAQLEWRVQDKREAVAFAKALMDGLFNPPR